MRIIHRCKLYTQCYGI